MLRQLTRPIVLAVLLVLSGVPAASAATLGAEVDVPASAAPLAQATAAVTAPAGADWAIPGRLVVGFAEGASALVPALAAVVDEHGARIVRVDTALGFAVVESDAAREAMLAAALLQVKGVAYAKPDQRVEATYTPSDPRYPEQWGPAALRMPDAWNTTLGSRDLTVAIVDTGVWAAHPDLAANMCVVGPDYPNADADAHDDHGHGTHVAGTVAAAISNGEGVAGMADACLMSVKVLDGSGSGSFADTASGIVWAVDNGADIISMSLGGCPGCDPGAPVTDAVAYAKAQGVLVVAAAGNAWCDAVSYPAAYPEVIAVASLDAPGDARSSFSSCGDDVEVAAPGRDVLSSALLDGPLSDPSGYMLLSGTSMATPHASGVAALVWSAHPSWSAEELRCVLAQTAVDLGDAGRDAATGHGRLDARAALDASGCVPSVPGAPAIDGRAFEGGARLTWSAPSSFGSDVSSYTLYRGHTPASLAPVATLDNATRRHDDLGLTNDVTYYYAVTATNAMGEGAMSNVREFTPRALACNAATDVFGNACSRTAYAFDDIRSVATPLDMGDDSLSAPIALPFAFSHYGTTRDTVRIGSNGFLTFGSSSHTGCCSGQMLPDAATPNDLIAAWWSDLLPYAGEVHYATTGLLGSRAFVVQYTDVPFFPGTGPRQTFQVKLLEADGSVEVHYADVDTGNRRISAGLEDCTGADGLTGLFDEHIIREAAFRYTPGSGTACTPAPPNVAPTADLVSPAEGSTVSGVIELAGVANDTDGPTFDAYVTIDHGQHFWWIPAGDFSFSVDTTTLSEGTHSAYLYVSDGETAAIDQHTFTVANGGGGNRPPNVDFASVPTPARGIVEIWGNASDPDAGDAVEAVYVSLDGGPGRLADGTSSWRYSFDSTAFPDGDHVASIVANDGEADSVAMNVILRIDNTPDPDVPPMAVITAPTDGARVAGTIMLEGYVSDDEPFAGPVFLGITGWAEWSVGSGTPWATLFDTTMLPDGAYELYAYAMDGNRTGPRSFVTMHVTNHPGNAPPTLAILAPAPGAVVEGRVVVEGTASDADGAVVLVQVRIDGGPWMDAYGTNAWSFPWETSWWWNGLHTIEARALDGYAYSTMDRRAVEVRNNHAPWISVYAPHQGARLDGYATVFGDAGDVDGDAVDVMIRIDGGAWLPVVRRDWSGWQRIVDTTTLADGLHELEARASDGRLESVQLVQFVVENELGLRISIETPADGDYLRGDAVATGRTWGGATVRFVEYRIDGGAWRLARGTDAWSAPLGLLEMRNDGWHVLEVRASDGATMARATTSFYVWNAPDLAITDIEVVRTPIQTDAGEAPNLVNERRLVRVTVQNVGSATSDGGDLRLELRSTGALWSYDELGTGWVDVLAPGASAVVELEWDTTTDFGDVTMYAYLETYGFDMDWRNNEREERTYVRVGGLGGFVGGPR